MPVFCAASGLFYMQWGKYLSNAVAAFVFGWLGYPMQVKINFLCRDSILAAPVCLDLCLLIDLAARAGRSGIQSFLSFFLKSPMHDYTKGEEAVNHLYRQHTMLKNAIREMGGYEADEELD